MVSVSLKLSEADVAISAQIKDVARKLLRQKEVELVIGFELGSLPLRFTPTFIRREEDVDRLIWNSFCGNNLAKYVSKRSEKTAIIAKACDVRAIVELIKEHQVSREQLVIVGVPYHGMLDHRRLEAAVGQREILAVVEEEELIILQGNDFTEVLQKKDYLCRCCKGGTDKNPPIYDILIGEMVEEQATDEYSDVAGFEARPPEERWNYICDELNKCIRCYACRDACPLCYCQECFVDSTSPRWIGRTTDLSDTLVFHLTRALHLAGRCVECGACERACPMGVDIRKLMRKILGDVKELYGDTAGVSLDEVCSLAKFKHDDTEAFMLDPVLSK